jgi:hypothetical protein
VAADTCCSQSSSSYYLRLGAVGLDYTAYPHRVTDAPARNKSKVFMTTIATLFE